MGVLSARMPAGRYFALTWSIPDQFGGMTAAMLHRSAAFHRVAGVSVDILTFDDRPDSSSLDRRLQDRGVLADGVRVVNLYDWLRKHPLPGGSLAADRVFTPLAEAEATEVRRSDHAVVARVRRGDDGRILQVDHLRPDGSLVLSDRRDVRERGALGGRSVVLCDGEGSPVRSWRRIRPLYTAWLDALTARQPSFMIVDSKTVAPFMLTYRRAHVVTAHVVHASHRPGAGQSGTVRASRREVFEHLDDYDLVAFLSRRQATEVTELVGAQRNLVVIPNSLSVMPVGDVGQRDPFRGVVLAALEQRKRVEDAVDAVQLANSRLEKPLRLDVYGDGECRSAIESHIVDPSVVRLHGYDPGARAKLAEASFLLLTSRSEGFPLVLVESLAMGCLPIAYDIRYGPADIIRDGRNGFVVPAGDVEALAAALQRLRDLPPGRVMAMRRAAVRSARRFDDERIVALWARELKRAAARKHGHSTLVYALRTAAARIPGARSAYRVITGAGGGIRN
ncbi:glycosyltransferase [Agromyces sp. NPDC049794]|uniref:glycosyltransferase n=1 Tax=unclassified Agromyces TaxID=2639701 RepID=UPI0033D2BD06